MRRGQCLERLRGILQQLTEMRSELSLHAFTVEDSDLAAGSTEVARRIRKGYGHIVGQDNAKFTGNFIIAR